MKLISILVASLFILESIVSMPTPARPAKKSVDLSGAPVKAKKIKSTAKTSGAPLKSKKKSLKSESATEGLDPVAMPNDVKVSVKKNTKAEGDLDPIAILLQLLNEYRTSKELGALELDPKLTEAADIQVEFSVKNGDMKHNFLDYATVIDNKEVEADKYPSTFDDRLKHVESNSGYEAENIAWTWNDERAMENWKDSTEHNANMLSPDFTKVGIAKTADPDNAGMFYYCQVFDVKAKE
jgi:uncharacterized protein YkwD